MHNCIKYLVEQEFKNMKGMCASIGNFYGQFQIKVINKTIKTKKKSAP